MGLLWVMKNWAKPSELWLQRQLDALAEHIELIACEAPEAMSWQQRVPAMALGNVEQNPRLSKRKWFDRFTRNSKHLSPMQRLRVAAESPNVTKVFVHNVRFALHYAPVWRQTDKPLFVHCHGYDVTWDYRYPTNRLGERVHPPDYRRQVLNLSQRATLIANSYTTARRLYDIGVPEQRVAVKYMGVEVPDAPSTRPARTAGLAVLYLGRLSDCKGPDLTLNAFNRTCELGFDGRLIMAGDGHMRIMCEMLRARSPFAGRIELLGDVDPKTGSQLRSEADIFTAHNCTGPLTGQEEAFGVSYAEAMASALPVVTGRNGSLPELITHGEHGLLCNPGDIETHSRYLLQLAGDPQQRQRLGENGWRRAKERFSVETEKKRLAEILQLD
jgi:glycosyltransferase involved in cell wall biosynthesis